MPPARVNVHSRMNVLSSVPFCRPARPIQLVSWVIAAVMVSACSPALSGVSGGQSTSPTPAVPWAPTHRPEPRPVGSVPDPPPELSARRQGLTLEDLIDLALRNSPLTRGTWASARAAAAAYGSERGTWSPTISADIDATRIKTAGTQGRSAVQQTIYGP